MTSMHLKTPRARYSKYVARECSECLCRKCLSSDRAILVSVHCTSVSSGGTNKCGEFSSTCSAIALGAALMRAFASGNRGHCQRPSKSHRSSLSHECKHHERKTAVMPRRVCATGAVTLPVAGVAAVPMTERVWKCDRVKMCYRTTSIDCWS